MWFQELGELLAGKHYVDIANADVTAGLHGDTRSRSKVLALVGSKAVYDTSA